MAVEIAIPKLGMTMKEAKVAKWMKTSGEWVDAGEVILVIETEKITYEIEAPSKGFLQILVPEGLVVPVGARVGLLHPGREDVKDVIGPEPPVEKEEALPPVHLVEDKPYRVKASPLAKKMAREHNLDLSQVMGTGPGGRIVRRDVLRALRSGAKHRKDVALKPPMEEIPEVKSVPLSGMRLRIAEHMHRSLQETAQMTLTREVDATALVELRRRLVERYEQQGLNVSYNSILVRMVAQALRENPSINVSLEGSQVLIWEKINIGVAVELDEGLIVPVVRSADKLSIVEIEKILQDLFERARTRKLTPDEVRGGTFTITNLGHLGIDAFTPILNRPESAILGVGRIRPSAAVIEEGGAPKIGVRSRMVLSLTVDHRLIDGAPAARFLHRVASLIEDPLSLVN